MAKAESAKKCEYDGEDHIYSAASGDVGRTPEEHDSILAFKQNVKYLIEVLSINNNRANMRAIKELLQRLAPELKTIDLSDFDSLCALQNYPYSKRRLVDNLALMKRFFTGVTVQVRLFHGPTEIDGFFKFRRATSTGNDDIEIIKTGEEVHLPIALNQGTFRRAFMQFSTSSGFDFVVRLTDITDRIALDSEYVLVVTGSECFRAPSIKHHECDPYLWHDVIDVDSVWQNANSLLRRIDPGTHTFETLEPPPVYAALISIRWDGPKKR